MKFQVIGPDKKCKAYTESEKCIPSERTLKEMRAAGYTFLKDGKKWVPGKEKT